MGKSKNDWRAIVTAYKTSGQRQTEWCQANNVNLSNLRYWLQKEKKMEPASEKKHQWLAVNLNTLEPTDRNQSLILQIGQVRLTVNPGFDPQFLTDVVQAIITIC